MTIYRRHAVQRLPISKKTAWEFLSNPKNLQEITPKELGFRIKHGADQPMYPGQVIEYTVTPLLGIKHTWVTEITHVIENEYFVDEQRFGPYALWHHKHFIKEINGGVEMEDLIHYKLPLGFIGKMFHGMLVSPQLDRIFEFRKSKLESLFGKL